MSKNQKILIGIGILVICIIAGILINTGKSKNGNNRENSKQNINQVTSQQVNATNNKNSDAMFIGSNEIDMMEIS